MKIDNKFAELREKAKSLLENDNSQINNAINYDINQLIEELNIYKIELDLQNEELLNSNHKLIVQKNRYESLYMDSPMAYFTLNKSGSIIDMNIEAALMLQIPLHKANLTSIFPYLTEESKIKINRFYIRTLESDSIEYEDIVFINSNNDKIYTSIKATNCIDCETNETLIRFAVTNQSQIKEYEKEIANQKIVNEIKSRYEILFNSSLSGVIITDANGIISECNNSFAEMLKCDKTTLKGKHIHEFTHPDEVEIESSQLNLLNKNNSKIRFEKRYIANDGSTVWADVTLSIFFANEKPEFYLGIINDITESKLTQEIISKNEKKFKTIVQNIPDIILHLDKEARFVDFYQDRDDLLFTPDEFMNKTVYDLFDKDFADKAQYHINQALKYGSSQFEYKFEFDNVMYHFLKFQKLNDNEVIVLISDVTELKEKEKVIKESKRRLDMFFNQSKDAYFFMSLEKPVKIEEGMDIDEIMDYVYHNEKVDKINKAALDIYNATEDDFIGKTPYDIFGDEKERKEIWKKLILEYQISIENKAFTMDGKELIVAGDYIALFDDNGYITGHFGIQRDVTEQRIAEQRINQLNQRLEAAMLSGDMAWWEMELPSGKIKFNENKAKILGRKKDDFKHYNDFMAIVHPDDYEPTMEAMYKVIRKEVDVYECQYRMKNSDNEYLWFQDTGIITSKTDGKIILTGIVHNITGKKRTENAIIESEEKFRSIIEYSPFGIMITNDKGIIIDCNKSFENIMDIKKDVIFNRHILEYHKLIFDSDERNSNKYDNVKGKIQNLYNNLYDLPQTYISTVYIKGKKKYLEQTIFKIDSGDNFLIASISIDITERFEYQKAIEKNERFLKSTINAITHPFYVVNVDDYTIALANDEIGGDAAIGKKCYEISHNSDTVCHNLKHPCPLNTVLDTKKPHVMEHLHYDKNGNELNVEVHAYPIFNENGEIKQIIEHNIDITEKKQIQKALADSNERFELAIKGSFSGIFDWNFITNEVYYSPQWKKLLGYEDDELPNELSTFENLLHSEDKNKVLNHLDKYLSNEINDYDLEARMKHKYDDYRWVRIKAAVFRDDNGKPNRMSGSHTDITQKKENELMIKRKNEELNKLNAEKDKFFSIIAHDLRSPLGGIMSLVDLIKNEFDNFKKDDLKAMINTIDISTVNVFKLLENLLEWSRMQRGMIPFEPKEYHLFDLVGEATIELHNISIKKEILFKIDIEQNIKINADKMMFMGIIRNIVSNAMKFTRNGGNVTVSANEQEDVTEILVKDTGIGMSDNIKNNIFNIEVNTSRKGTSGESSSGLGLMLCKEFVEKHNGKILVESKIDEGSAFRIQLPK